MMCASPEEPLLVLIVDDDPSMRRALERLLRSGGLATESFASGEELLEALDTLDPAFAVVDIHLPGIDGLDVQRELLDRRPGLPVLIITGYDDPEVKRHALAAGAVGYLLKPFSQPDLVDVVRSVVKRRTGDSEGQADSG